MSQDILDSISKKKAKASGYVRTEDHKIEVVMEYAVQLHPNLVSFDTVNVLSFESADKFVSLNVPWDIVPGSILIGTLRGRWCVPALSCVEHCMYYHNFKCIPAPLLLLLACVMRCSYGAIVCVIRSSVAGSAHALFFKGDMHTDGGFAYLRRVTSIHRGVAGVTTIETTDEIGIDNILPKGKIAVGWNHTKVQTLQRYQFVQM